MNCSSFLTMSRSTRDWRRKKLAAVHDAMADRGETPAFLRLPQPVEQEVQAGLVLRFLAAGEVEGDFMLARRIFGDQSGAGADAVNLAGNGGFLLQATVQLEKRKLDRRRAGIDGEDATSHSGVFLGTVSVGDERGDDAGGDARLRSVGTAGQDNRHAGAEDDAGGQRVGEIFELLGDHVS